MDVRCSLIWSVLLTVTISSGQCCLVDNTWSLKSTYDLLDMADIVVYGRDTKHVERTGVHVSSVFNNVTDCLFQVYCVLKGNVTNEDIIIEHISPLSACSGSREKLNVGMKKIVALKMAESGNYRYFEGNAMQSSVYESDVSNFQTMDSLVEISEWQSPLGAEEGTCQSALATMTISNATANVTANLPKANVTIATKSSPQATEPTAFSTTAATKEPVAKVAANLESNKNSAETLAGLFVHLFLFSVLVTIVIN
ncbi:uncharacterized protein LOC117330951 [Pecten maximus]|uniref:uncharacterized protein LOC117330951 n=1 Tax=Pecten maximus TaxID=6579 RepID=UPI001459021D|nr:uncharacterized protein LOC117330951 [Pecten maximus]